MLETPGTPRAADIPAVPVAGAAAQQANQRGFQIPNPQDANNPLGNPLGFVGRLFGAPAQAPGPLPANQNNNAQNAIVAGQGPQGILIQYQIQYQLPRQNALQEPQHIQPRQPVPRFPGLPGPGGSWQQWPQSRPASQANSTSSASTAGSETPQNTDPFATPSASVGGVSSGSNSPMTTSSDPGTPETARDAAALAAIRRLGGDALDVSRSPSQRPAMVNTLQSSPSASNAPKLIPLYNFNLQNPPSQHRSPIAANGVRTPSPPWGRRPPIRSENGFIFPHLHPEQTRQQDPRVSVLPSLLTEQQLQIMDRLTREAIDERLKVLESVSGTLHRCVDDLMRMRSVLPPMPVGPSTSNDSSDALTVPTELQKTEDNDGSAIDSSPESVLSKPLESEPHAANKSSSGSGVE